MPAPFGPTIPIRSPRWAARNGIRATTWGSAEGDRLGTLFAPQPGQVADRQVLGRTTTSPERDGPAPVSDRVASLSRLAALGASIRSA